MYEYYWLREYVALIDDAQIERDLLRRTSSFNALGEQGWEFFPYLHDEPHHYCFRRNVGGNRKKIEYKWIRHYIPLHNEEQIQRDMSQRAKLFNSLAQQGWEFVHGELCMYCFMRIKAF